MKIKINKNEMLKILSVCENVISSKNTLSIMSNILIESDIDKIKITAIDTKLNLYSNVDCEIIETGGFCVNSNKLFAIIKKLPGDYLMLENKQGALTMSPFIEDKINLDIKYSLKTLGLEKFPLKKEEDVDVQITLNKDVFCDMLKKCFFIVPINATNRRFCSGVYFQLKNKELKITATDGKRLANIKKSNDYFPDIQSIEKIIPLRIIQEVIRLNGKSENITLGFSKDRIKIQYEKYLLTSLLLDGNFPPYESIIPKSNSLYIKVCKKSLMEGLNRISQISDKESRKITIDILSENKIVLKSEDIAIGYGEEFIYASNNIAFGTKININYNYILDFLNNISNNTVFFRTEDNESIIVLEEENNPDYIYLMMPMSS